MEPVITVFDFPLSSQYRVYCQKKDDRQEGKKRKKKKEVKEKIEWPIFCWMDNQIGLLGLKSQ